MMKSRFKKVMSYFFNFNSAKTPKRKPRKSASCSRDHLENESQYVIRRLNEASLTPRDNVSFSRYTPLPRIGAAKEHKQQQQNEAAVLTQAPATHIVTYTVSPARANVSHQLSPLTMASHTEPLMKSSSAPTVTMSSHAEHPTIRSDHSDSNVMPSHSDSRPRLRRQDTYIVTNPVILKGTLLNYLLAQDTMVTTRVRRPPKPRSLPKQQPISSKPKSTVARVSNAKARLNEIKAKLKREQEERKDEGQGGFWLEY